MASRPQKRQKLDIAAGGHKSSPAAAAAAATTSGGFGGASRASGAAGDAGSPDGQAEWRAAKLYAQRVRAVKRVGVGKRGKREVEVEVEEKEKEKEKKEKREVDPYEDFEGAHRGGRGRGGEGKESVESSGKRGHGVELGSFRKFAKEGQGGGSMANAAVHGDARGPRKVSEPVPRTSARGKGWITATGPPKKTFEDEMREIQERAQQTLQEEGSEDELARPGAIQRMSGRRLAQGAVSGPASAGAGAASVNTKRQTLDRRKKAVLRESSLEVPESDDGADMEVEETSGASDDLENEMFEDTRETPKAIQRSPPPAQKLATPSKPVAKPTRTAVATAKAALQDDQLDCIRSIVLGKATGERPITLLNLNDQYAKVANVITQTVTAGESNSMLLIGARGSGKTAMVEQIVREQEKTHADDFHVVRLNGFIHTDDKIALRDIWRQLGREMDIDEDEAVSKNYADTMTRLLALLSHPAENGIETEQVTKSVIFILDEFELFAGHPRQTLLYNLFDIAQSRKAPIAVLGLTTRIDVVESLEKRVKSRFSHRYVHLSLSKSLLAFEQVCKSATVVHQDELSEGEGSILGHAGKKGRLTMMSAEESATLTNWNAVVEELFASETCKTLLQRLYYTTKSVPEYLTTLTLALSTLQITSQYTHSVLEHLATCFSHMTALQAPDSKLSLLPTLSTLQFALLVCAARLTNIYSTELITFPLVYEEYKVLASKAKLHASAAGAIASAKVWGKSVARSAWEGLIEVGLVMPDGAGAGGAGRVDVGLEELRDCGVEMGGWGKWCREI